MSTKRSPIGAAFGVTRFSACSATPIILMTIVSVRDTVRSMTRSQNKVPKRRAVTRAKRRAHLLVTNHARGRKIRRALMKVAKRVEAAKKYTPIGQP
jgi:histidyl-tRNA synthetase